MGIKITSTDRIFTQIVKELAGWECERCRKLYGQSAPGYGVSHFYGRNVTATRISEENCMALCRGCHQWLSDRPPEYCKLMEKRLGHGGFMRLQVRASLGPAVKLGCFPKLTNIALRKQLEEIRNGK